MAVRQQQRRGTAAQWTSANPILSAAEIGYETDTNKFKIGDGTNRWSTLSYFVDLDTMIAGAPGLLNSLDEIAAAINDDPAFFTTIASSLSSKAPIASPTFTGTVSGITKSMVGLANVDNTSDANKPVSSATQTALDAKLASATAASTYAPIASPTFTGTVSGVTKSMVGLGNVDNTADTAKPVSTATQTALNLKAPLASPTFTGTVVLPTGTITSTMILDGTIVNADINNSAAIAWTKIASSSTVSETELGYLDGVTSAIQTQLNAKLNSADIIDGGGVQ